MSTITVLGQAAVSNRQAAGFIRRCWDVLQERRRREKLRAVLYGLEGHELKDIGITHGGIEYVVSHPDFDPREA